MAATPLPDPTPAPAAPTAIPGGEPITAHATRFEHGVVCIDTGFHRPRFDAAWLVVEDGRAAFVDTGPAPGVPRLLAALDAAGVARDAVDWVIPTHVHLDHAGGVGQLMRELPNATAVVHPRGVRHLVDPSALWAGATAVYGEAEMARSYAELLPVDASRVRPSHDGMTVDLAGRELRLADTPGHARHHHCVWDAASRGWFTGDTFGLSYREFDTARGAWILPTTTPVQFDPDALAHSIRRLLAEDPRWIYLTHFGRVGDVARLGRQLLVLLDSLVAIARESAAAPDRQRALEDRQFDLYAAALANHGCAMDRAALRDFLALDLQLNAQGIGIWLDREAERAAPTDARDRDGR